MEKVTFKELFSVIENNLNYCIKKRYNFIKLQPNKTEFENIFESYIQKFISEDPVKYSVLNCKSCRNILMKLMSWIVVADDGTLQIAAFIKEPEPVFWKEFINIIKHKAKNKALPETLVSFTLDIKHLKFALNNINSSDFSYYYNRHIKLCLNKHAITLFHVKENKSKFIRHVNKHYLTFRDRLTNKELINNIEEHLLKFSKKEIENDYYLTRANKIILAFKNKDRIKRNNLLKYFFISNYELCSNLDMHHYFFFEDVLNQEPKK